VCGLYVFAKLNVGGIRGSLLTAERLRQVGRQAGAQVPTVLDFDNGTVELTIAASPEEFVGDGPVIAAIAERHAEAEYHGLTSLGGAKMGRTHIAADGTDDSWLCPTSLSFHRGKQYRSRLWTGSHSNVKQRDLARLLINPYQILGYKYALQYVLPHPPFCHFQYIATVRKMSSTARTPTPFSPPPFVQYIDHSIFA